MPKVALADTLTEWDQLLAGLEEDEALDLPHMRELRERLAALIHATRELVTEQAYLKGRKQAVTQQLRITRRLGQDLVVEVRSLIRGQLGHRNERLVSYKIRPTRQRRRTTQEHFGVSQFPRPDLLSAVGLTPEAVPPAPAASSEPPASPPVPRAGGDVSPEEI